MGVTSMVAGNKYTFHCPVMGEDQLFLACAFRRYKHWRGEKLDKPGCGTCMNGGKCPIVPMVKMEWTSEKPLFMDTTERVHRIPKAIEEHQAAVRIVPMQGLGTGVSNAELSRLCGYEAVLPTAMTHEEMKAASPKPRGSRRVADGSSVFDAPGSTDAIADHIGDGFSDHLSAA